MRLIITFVMLALVAAADAGEIDAKVEAALAAEARPAADRVRDGNRRPLETLTFFGLEDDMRVLELIPGPGIDQSPGQPEADLPEVVHLTAIAADGTTLAETDYR